MRIAKQIPSLRREDGSIKDVSTAAYTPKNYRRIFLNQTLPVLGLFANRSTQIVLYLLMNTDSNNMLYCTYTDIMEDCKISDRKVVAQVLKELQEAEVLVKISQSHYMVNPAVMLQGNDRKYGLLASQFNSMLREKQAKTKGKQEDN